MGDVIAFPGQPHPDEVTPDDDEEFDLDMTLLNIECVAKDMQEAEVGDLPSLLSELHRLALRVEDHLNQPSTNQPSD